MVQHLTAIWIAKKQGCRSYNVRHTFSRQRANTRPRDYLCGEYGEDQDAERNLEVERHQNGRQSEIHERAPIEEAKRWSRTTYKCVNFENQMVALEQCSMGEADEKLRSFVWTSPAFKVCMHIRFQTSPLHC